ncbi:hypothetical protein BGZ73_007409 [Actinomortierella ambigua]|nr:hypothetical protein BGZ73_007409 [Actinomortierella ambigua]
MKFTLSVAVLALAASQAMAVVPTPVPGCTKSIVIQPSDKSCYDFGLKWGVTMDQLLKMNLKLREDCANLDVDHPICIATTGPSQPPITPTGGPVPTSGAVVPTTAGPAPTQAPQPSQPPKVSQPPHSSGAVNAPSSTNTPAGASRTGVNTPVPTGAAVVNKGSFLVACAGVVLSAVYML